MFCKNCGNQIADAAVVCPKCGVSVAGKSIAKATEQVPNHMVWAILTTIFCCLIGGIFSIVYALKVNTKLAQGDVAGARAASKTAKRWIVVNVVALPLISLLGIIIGAISPIVSSAMHSADAKACSMRGRNLFIGITQANAEREAAGLVSVWPRGYNDRTDDTDDVSGMTFDTSTEYFRELFDVNNYGQDSWAPYVNGLDISVLKLSEDSDFCDWIVAANVKDEYDDVIPVLISANVNPSALRKTFNGYDNTRIPFGSEVGRTKLPWCDDFVVVVRKGGAVQVFKRRNFTYSNLYNCHPFSAPELEYLDIEQRNDHSSSMPRQEYFDVEQYSY